MPSIPQSLLWISLVVLWLFVLVPMLISKRDAVRRTSDVALATRVLNTGRGARLRRRGPAAGHYSDPDWRPSADDEFDDYAGDDELTKPRKAVVLAAATATAEPDYLDVDVVEMDSGALPVGSVSRATVVEPQLPLEFDDQRSQDTNADTDADVVASPPTEAIRTFADADFAEPDVASDDSAATDGQHPSADEPEDDLVGSDGAEHADASNDGRDDEAADGTDHDYEYVDDSSGIEAPPENDQKLSDSMSQARRQRYETKTSLAVRERKFAFRKRMLIGMGVLLVGSAVAASLLTPTLWWVCGGIGAVTVLYLGYLRRQTRIEEQLRRRRAKRVARSRLGVENTDDPEYDVVPSRLRRPGAVVLDIDDEDPIFEHLDHASLAATYDLPRASGQ